MLASALGIGALGAPQLLASQLDDLDQSSRTPYEMVPTALDGNGNLVRSQPFPEQQAADPAEQLGSASWQGFTTAGELCPADRFRASLELVASKLGLHVIDRAGGWDVVVQYFEEHQASNKCVGRLPDVNWPRSSAYPRQRLDGSGDVNGLLINVGAGERSLSFLGCVMGGMGLRRLARGGEQAQSMRLRLHGACGLLPQASDDGRSCTDLWDEYDYVDDWPVEDQLPQLLASHAGPLNAGVLLPLVDPFTWVNMRMMLHENAGAVWTAPSPCSGHGPRLEEDEAPIAKLSHDAWAACVAVSDGRGVESLLAFTLSKAFSPEAGTWLREDFSSELHAFLRAHADRAGLSSNYTLERVQQATRECSYTLSS